MSQMSTVGTSQISNYDSRIVEINVTGVCRQNVKRVSNYTMKVPHNRMNQAMREIHSLGGKIASVTVLGQPQIESQAQPAEEPKKKTTPAKRQSRSRSTRKNR